MADESDRYRMTDPERILKLEQELRFLKERRRELQEQIDDMRGNIRQLEQFRDDLHGRLSTMVWWLGVMASAVAAGMSLVLHLIFK